MSRYFRDIYLTILLWHGNVRTGIEEGIDIAVRGGREGQLLFVAWKQW